MKVMPFYFGKNGTSCPEFLDWELTRGLQKAGVQFVRNRSDAEEIWLFDATLASFLKSLAFQKSQRRLLIFEPEAVNPLQHQLFFQSRFREVLVFSEGQLSKFATFVPGGGLRTSRMKSKHDKDDEKEFDFVMAAGNKYSVVDSSMYDLRRKLITSLVKEGYSVGLAGPGWREETTLTYVKAIVFSFIRTLMSARLPRLSKIVPMGIKIVKSYSNLHVHGWVDDEIDFFRRGTTVICIENDIRACSEKIFSAICARRSVVYVGPPEAMKYLTHLPVYFQSNTNFFSILNACKEARESADFSIEAPIDTRLAFREESAFYSRLIEALLR